METEWNRYRSQASISTHLTGIRGISGGKRKTGAMTQHTAPEPKGPVHPAECNKIRGAAGEMARKDSPAVVESYSVDHYALVASANTARLIVFYSGNEQVP